MMNLKALFVYLLLIATGYGIFYFTKNKEGYGIPNRSFMIDESQIISTYFDHRNEKSVLVKHNFNTGETTELA